MMFLIQHIATGWANARNMLRPTMLRYVAMKCCDRLAGACKCWDSNMLRSFGRGLRGTNFKTTH